MSRSAALAAASATIAWAVGPVAPAWAQLPVGPGPTNYTVQPQPAPGSCHYRAAADGDTLPDPVCTPGATNPKVTPQTLAGRICRAGYTKSIRPPKSITETEKQANADAYGYTGPLSGVEFDHRVPLALGGDPNDPPQPVGAAGRVTQPQRRRGIQAARPGMRGAVPLAAAQEAIAADWTTALVVAG